MRLGQQNGALALSDQILPELSRYTLLKAYWLEISRYILLAMTTYVPMSACEDFPGTM